MNKGALWNKIEKAFDVQIEHPVHFSRQQSRVQCIQRLMLASPWPEPVRKAEKIRALGASFRLGVRDAFCCCGFPLVRPLPSVPSAAGCPALFGDFAGTTGLSDFPCSFIIGVRP